MTVTEGEKGVFVDVAIVISPLVATVEFAVASIGVSEDVLPVRVTEFAKGIVCIDASADGELDDLELCLLGGGSGGGLVTTNEAVMLIGEFTRLCTCLAGGIA